MKMYIKRKGPELLAVMLCLGAVFQASCKKFVDIGKPETALDEKTTFENETTATAALLDAYYNLNLVMAGSASTATPLFINAMYTDEYTLTSSDATLMAFHTNSVQAENTSLRLTWSNSYGLIYKVNAAIENIEKYGAAIPSASKDQLIGEAKFLRAFCYFHLANVYGDVPVLLTSDYQQNMRAPRSPLTDVYKQIVTDLEAARQLLNAAYVNDQNAPGNARIRPNKDVATAMLARVYLYMGRWQEAQQAATAIIQKGSVYSLEPLLENVFHTVSKEAIFQLPANFAANTPNVVTTYRLTGAPTSNASHIGIGVLSNSLLSHFEPGDLRGGPAWVGTSTAAGNTYYFANKYKYYTVLTQYFTCLRLAELYLIRAEANIRLDQVAEGIGDLNVIRDRARAAATAAVPDPLPRLPETLSKKEAMLALENERRSELYMEGHRWFDLRRWPGIDNPSATRAAELMPGITAAKGSTWEAYKILLPLPQTEILINTNLVQNDEY